MCCIEKGIASPCGYGGLQFDNRFIDLENCFAIIAGHVSKAGVAEFLECGHLRRSAFLAVHDTTPLTRAESFPAIQITAPPSRLIALPAAPPAEVSTPDPD